MSEKGRSSPALPRRWASSMSTPPVMRPISLAIKTASAKSSPASTSRTAGPAGRVGVRRRGSPPLWAMTDSAASRMAGAER